MRSRHAPEVDAGEYAGIDDSGSEPGLDDDADEAVLAFRRWQHPSGLFSGRARRLDRRRALGDAIDLGRFRINATAPDGRSLFVVVGNKVAIPGFLAEQLHPDVILLDLSMPTLNGIGAVRELSRVSPLTTVIVLTMHTEEHYILEALRAGVKGCVSKTQAARPHS